MRPSRKRHSCAIASFLATPVVVGAAAPGAFAATTVTYNSGGTSPGMNITDDPGNAAMLVITSGSLNNHVGVRSNAGPLTAGGGCLQVSRREVQVPGGGCSERSLSLSRESNETDLRAAGDSRRPPSDVYSRPWCPAAAGPGKALARRASVSAASSRPKSRSAMSA